MQNLQSLKKILNPMLSEEVCKRIANVEKLSIVYDDLTSENSSCDFVSLHLLESLKCGFKKKANWDNLLRNLTFPSSLQKLAGVIFLRSMIGSLPNLQVLKLKNNSFTSTGGEWNPVEEAFPRLKFLLLHDCDLINWNISAADTCNFPALEKLALCQLKTLKEILSGIGATPTLEFIRLDRCSESAAISAMRILKEEESLANQVLRVQICKRNSRLMPETWTLISNLSRESRKSSTFKTNGIQDLASAIISKCFFYL